MKYLRVFEGYYTKAFNIKKNNKKYPKIKKFSF